MRTALFSPCYLDGSDPLGNFRVERYIAYVKYYLAIQEELGFDHLWLADNASAEQSAAALFNGIGIGRSANVRLHRFDEHLARGPGPNEYPYCWRGMYFIRQLILDGYDKIILIDSDAYVTSERMAHYIRSLDTGWTTFWCKRYQFPTAECYVLCKDAFPGFLAYTDPPWQAYVGNLMETSLPFTLVNREFQCDRSGETLDVQGEDQDLYAQARLILPPRFVRSAAPALPQEPDQS